MWFVTQSLPDQVRATVLKKGSEKMIDDPTHRELDQAVLILID